MGSFIQNERKICGGRVMLYQRTDVKNSIWQCRISFPKQPAIRHSLGTSDEKEAEKAATKLYEDYKFRFERGVALRRKKFEEVLADYLTYLEQEVETGVAKAKKLADHKAMSWYCLEYFKGRPIDGISTGDVNKFNGWRKVYWISGPGSEEENYTYERQGKVVVSKFRAAKMPALSTQNSEIVLLRAIFNHAAANDWIPQSQIPVLKVKIPHAKKGKDARRRPGLDGTEVKKLLAVSEKRLQETDDDRLHHQRAMLHAFIGMMAYGGMRPFECMKLKWKDISFTPHERGKQYSKVYVSGKSKSRWLIPLDEFDLVVDRLVTYTMDLRREREPDFDGTLPCDDRPVFCDIDGNPIKSFVRGFSALLKDAGLHIDPETKKTRDAYCLRHYYATERIIAGVSVYTLAENMGTSVQMIERHYSHLKPEMAAEELTKQGKGKR